MAQRLAVLVEQLAELVFARGRFAQQAAVADLFDVARFQVDLDGEAVLQLVQLGRVERGARVVLGQGLLGGADDPDLAVADALQVLGQAIQVEDQVVARADILAHFVDDKDDVLLAGRLADDVDHLFHPLVFENE